jgi:DNA repair exonuclease SbcCD ATPase subunit
MLTELSLTSFQPHASLTIPLSPITVITGRSDAGKSSIIRALAWVLWNRGTPAKLLRRGDTIVSAALTISGHKITRTSQFNAYWLDEREFRVVGRTLPDDIVRILKISTDSIQFQHEYFFWFSETGSGLVTRIEETFGLHEPASWIDTAKTEYNAASRTVKQLQTELEGVAAEISRLQPYEQLNEQYQELVSLSQAAETLRHTISALNQIQQEYRRHTAKAAVQLDDWERLVAVGLSCRRAAELGLSHKAAAERTKTADYSEWLDALSELYDKRYGVIRVGKALREYQNQRKVLAADYSDALENVLSASVCRRRLDTVYNEYARHKVAARAALTAQSAAQQALQELTGTACPTCGQIMKEIQH